MRNGVPKGWAETTLTRVAYFQEGPGLRKWQFGEGGIPFLNIRTFENGRIDRSKCQFVKREEFEGKYEHFLLKEGDIVVSSSGTLGKIAVVSPGDLPLMLNTSTIRFRSIHPELLTQNFLRFFLQSHHFYRQIESAKTGSAIFNYGPSHLKQMRILLPPLGEQRRIAAKLDILLGKVDGCQKRLAKIPMILKRFRQAVLAAACSGRLTSDWRAVHVDLEPADQLVERIFSKRQQEYTADCKKAKTEGKKPPKKPNNLEPRRVETAGLPEIPDEWTWIHLPELGYMSRGKSKHRPRNAPHLFGGPYPFIQTGDIAQSSGRITSHRQTYSEAGLAQSHLWSSGTVCITIAANIANSAILTYPACFPDSIVGLTPDEAFCIKEYVEFFIRTARSNLDQFAPATAQKNINIEILSDVAVPLPPLAEQKEIVHRVEAMFKLAEAVEKRVAAATTRAERLSQAILAKAFRGELVPTEAELARRKLRSYEPGSELLARINSERDAKQTSQKARRNRN